MGSAATCFRHRVVAGAITRTLHRFRMRAYGCNSSCRLCSLCEVLNGCADDEALRRSLLQDKKRCENTKTCTAKHADRVLNSSHETRTEIGNANTDRSLGKAKQQTKKQIL